MIEVVGALVIFSVGVLMVLRLSTVLGTQMTYAGTTSELTVSAAVKLDSIGASNYQDSLTTGVTSDTVLIEGVSYLRSVTVTMTTPVLASLSVSLTPLGGGGPTHTVSSYVSLQW